jgi:hypothetical protein
VPVVRARLLDEKRFDFEGAKEARVRGAHE